MYFAQLSWKCSCSNVPWFFSLLRPLFHAGLKVEGDSYFFFTAVFLLLVCLTVHLLWGRTLWVQEATMPRKCKMKNITEQNKCKFKMKNIAAINPFQFHWCNVLYLQLWMGGVVLQTKHDKHITVHVKNITWHMLICLSIETPLNRLQTSCSTSAVYRLGCCHLFAHASLFLFVRRQTAAIATLSFNQCLYILK